MFASRGTKFLAGAALAGLIGIAASAGAAERSEYVARQQIDRTLQLQPGSRVEVSGIAGPVTVEIRAGSHAEAHVSNMAHSQRELECSRLEVTGSLQSLKVSRVDGERRGDCRNIQNRQEVHLILPPSSALSISGIAGTVDIGRMEGPVRLSGIAGRATVAGARSADISGLAGKLSLGLGALDAKGVRISGISGSVDLTLRPGTNADVEIDSVIGSVTSDSPGLRLVQRDRGYRARLGAGGPRLSISAVTGPVRLKIS